jgi:uncharacterized repeat protein (TIGR02543 family)
MRKKENGTVLKITFAVILMAALVPLGLLWTGCPTDSPIDSPIDNNDFTDTSSAPAAETAERTAGKTSAVQQAVSFTLTSGSAGVWKVYAQETGGEALAGVSAAFNAETLILTLSSAEEDLPAGTYWVSVTEADKAESPRLGLTVAAYTPPPQSSAPAAEAAERTAGKTSAVQQAISFTLTSGSAGVWKVYAQETGGEALAGVSAAFNAETLVLTLSAAEADIPLATYWVSVTEAGKTESLRLGLTILEYLPATLTLELESGAITARPDTGTAYPVPCTSGVTPGSVNSYGVIDFAAAADNIDLSQTPARKYLSRNAWTMEMYVKIANGGGSNADFLQFWTVRNEAPTFRIEIPNWLFITHDLNAQKRIGADAFVDGWRHIAIVKSGNDLTLFVNGTQTTASDGYGNFNTDAFNEVSVSSIGTSRTGGTQLYKYIVHNRALETADFSGVQAIVNELNRITVTFDANGGTFSEPGNPVTKEIDIFRPANTVGNLPTPPENGSKIFAGWFPGANGTGEAFTSLTQVTAHTTVYAKWSDAPVTYDVTFDAYFGAFPDAATAKTVTVTSPNPVGSGNMPANPALAGFTFSGWYTGKSDTDWGAEFTAASPISADTTVYAKWVWNDSLGINAVTYAVNSAGTALEGRLSDGSAYNETFAPAVVSGGGVIAAVNGLNVSTGNRYDFGPQAGALLSKSDWTLEFYVRSTSTATNITNPLNFYRIDDNKTNGCIWIENYNWYFIVREASTSVRTQTPANTAANTWHHIAYVKTSADGNKILVYVDGTALAQGNNPSFNMLVNNAYFKSLFHNYFGGSQFNFYKFALYSRAWEAGEGSFTAAMAVLDTLNGVSGE